MLATVTCRLKLMVIKCIKTHLAAGLCPDPLRETLPSSEDAATQTLVGAPTFCFKFKQLFRARNTKILFAKNYEDHFKVLSEMK